MGLRTPIARLSYDPLARLGNMTMLREATNVPRRTLVRWAGDGVPVEQADKVAVALGYHPAELWSEWWDQ